MKENININNGSNSLLAIVLLILFCWDTPKGDLLDAVVSYLLK